MSDDKYLTEFPDVGDVVAYHQISTTGYGNAVPGFVIGIVRIGEIDPFDHPQRKCHMDRVWCHWRHSWQSNWCARLSYMPLDRVFIPDDADRLRASYIGAFLRGELIDG